MKQPLGRTGGRGKGGCGGEGGRKRCFGESVGGVSVKNPEPSPRLGGIGNVGTENHCFGA